LDPETIREAFGAAAVGSDVVIAAEGDTIVIRRD
jgi:hypothetical protein